MQLEVTVQIGHARTLGLLTNYGMANGLGDEKRQQVLALGRLGWPLRRI